MTRHNQGPLTVVGFIAAGIFLVAFLALMFLGEFGFIASFFMAALIAVLSGIVIYLGFGGPDQSSMLSKLADKTLPGPMKASEPASASKPAAAPKAAPAPKTATATPAPKSAAAPKAAPTPKAPPEKPAKAAEPVMTADASEDYDGAGVAEGTGEGTRPAGLDAPRGGKADDLKQIKGVGPKMEKLCNSLGFWHFDQIANWTADEVAWVDANLEGFKGRVTRDTWVEQARILSGGGATEFSKRVEGGDVY